MLEFKTSKGTFTVQLFDKQAPISVANFYKYADEGYFDGTIFHRVIPGFMVQGGGLTADMKNKRGHGQPASLKLRGVQLLSQREHSVHELRQKLLRHARLLERICGRSTPFVERAARLAAHRVDTLPSLRHRLVALLQRVARCLRELVTRDQRIEVPAVDHARRG